MTRKVIFFQVISIFLLSNAIAQQPIVNVNPLTGMGSVVIPIHTISKGGVSVPISLVYAASVGPKDGDASAGVGWNLQASGQISRELRGLPDDYKQNGRSQKGWLYTISGTKIANFTIANDGNTGTCTDETTDTTYLYNNFPDSVDTEPDIYHVNAPGLSCKFMFDKDNHIRIISGDDLKVSYVIFDTSSDFTGLANAIYSFTIVNNRGVSYVFNRQEITTKGTSSPDESQIKYFKRYYKQYRQLVSYYSAWKLSTIRDAAGNTVNYNYGQISNSFSRDTVALYIGGSATRSVQFTILYNSYRIEMEKIYATAPGGFVTDEFTFDWQQVRLLRVQTRLYTIRGLGRKYELTYEKDNFGQLSFLKRFRDSSCTSGIDYRFNYANEAVAKRWFGDSTIRNIDYWGYYTGRDHANNTLKPGVYVNPSNSAYQRYAIRSATTAGTDYTYYLGNYHASVAYRSADPDSVMTGQLNEIVNGQGAKTTIIYESNDYLDVPSNTNNYGGGIRVKQIIDYNGIDIAQSITRNYTYTDPVTGKSSGKPISLPVYAFTKKYTGGATGSSYWNNSTVLSEIDLSDEDHSILYKYVKVSQTGTGSSLNEYYIPATNWDNSATPSCDGCSTADWAPTINYVARNPCVASGSLRNDTYSYPFAMNPNYDFERGLIKSVKNYNDSGQKVSESNYTYQRAQTPAIIYGLSFDTNEDAKAYAKYKVYVEADELSKTVENITYDQPTLTQSKTTITEFTYGSTNHRLLTEQRATNSDNSIISTNIKYIKDYTDTSGTDVNVKAIAKLQQKNINVPVETIQKVTRGATTKTVGASLTRFNKFTVDADVQYPAVDHYMPSQQLNFTSVDGVTNFQPFAITSGTPSQDSRYFPTANFLSYDRAGHLQTADNANKQVQAIITDVVSEQPLAVFSHAADKEIGFSDFESHGGELIPLPCIFTLTGSGSVTPSGSHTGDAIGFQYPQTLSKTLKKNALSQNYVLSIWLKALPTAP